MSWHSKGWNYVKYNLLTLPIIAVLYLPYQIFWIGLSPAQFIKWITTTGVMSLVANVFLQPWLSWLYHRKLLK